jgi:serine/threonine protein kinase
MSSFSEVRIALITIDMIGVLEHLHSQKIVHRDLKSQNVVLDRPMHFYGEAQLTCKLGDHGLSCFVTKRPEILCGEDEYLAPELVSQYVERRELKDTMERKLVYYDVGVDVWALGCLVFELFTGRMPFGKSKDREWGNRLELFDRIQTHDLDLNKEVHLQSNLKAQLFIKACLTKSPDRRPRASDLMGLDWIKEMQPLIEVRKAKEETWKVHLLEHL